MNYRRLLFLLLIICFLVSICPTIASVEKKPNHLVCEDGEEFFIQEKQTVQTINIISPKNDLIIIDARKLQLTFFRNGRAFKTYPVAIGEPETPSPIGEWKIIHKGGNWGDGFGVRWLGINVPWGIYGIHGTNKPWSIGARSSHGCIRMFNKHVLELYNLVKLGTPVHIIGDLPKVAIRKEVKRNNTGRDIVALQFALRKTGFDPGAADGRFGIKMEQAVYKLQFFYGLTPTGRLTLNEQIILGIRKAFWNRGELR